MAITQLFGTFMQGGNKTSESSTVVGASVSSGSTAIGDLHVVSVAADNAGTSGVESITTCTDSRGNTYTKLTSANRTSGTANDGCTAALFYSILTTAFDGTETLTINFSPNTTAKAIMTSLYRGTASTNYSSDSATGSGTTYSSNASASMASGDLYVATVANESNTAPVTDSDTTNGSWIGDSQISGGGGGDATKMSVAQQVKITTGVGSQTLNAATGANTDWALVAALFTIPAVAGKSPPFAHKHRNYIIR